MRPIDYTQPIAAETQGADTSGKPDYDSPWKEALGGQCDGMDYHKMIFDEPFLEHELLGLGFRNVRRWDWRETEHCAVDGYCQCYLPHLDKEQGALLSLNLEATR